MDPISLLVGGVVSLIVQLAKRYMGTNAAGTIAAVLVLSLVGAGAEIWLQHAGYWSTFLQVLTVAGAFYGFIIKNAQDVVASYNA